MGRSVTRRLAQVENTLARVSRLTTDLDDAEVLLDLADEADDPATRREVDGELLEIERNLAGLERESLFFDEYDDHSAILAVHAGAGGVDAQDWAEMLARMYQRYLSDAGLNVIVEDVTEGEEAGVKSVTMTVRGDHAYGTLEGERGVHRLVRISPFDSNARRQTSFAGVDVVPELSDAEALESTPTTCASTPIDPRAPVDSTSIRPIRRCGLPTFQAAWSSRCRMNGANSKTRLERWRFSRPDCTSRPASSV